MRIIYNPEKKKIIEKLAYYGITDLPFLLLRFGKEKIRGYSGDLSIDEIRNFDNTLRIELMGLYLFHEYNDEVRLSIEALHLLRNQITKNILKLTEEQAKKWFLGEDIDMPKEWESETPGFKALWYKDDFIGCGKLAKDRLVNYMPKERRIKKKQ